MFSCYSLLFKCCVQLLTFFFMIYLLLLVADNAGVIVNNKGEMKGKISDMAISLLSMRSICG